MNRRAFTQTAAAALFAPSLRSIDSPGSQSYVGIHPPSEKFLATLPNLMELATVPGIGIGVVRAGQPIWQYYVGVSNANTKTPINPDSLFPAASLGKQPFAFAVLRLADQGKLVLDRPLNQYLAGDPITSPDGDRVTARHILSHTSGLPNWRNSAKEPLLPAFTPGTKFRYSGEGFYHLQRVIETITGIGFEAWIETNLFTPLSMTSSTYLWSATAKDHFVAGHYRDEPQTNTESRAAIFSLIQSSNLPLSSWNHARIVQAMMQQSKNTVPPPPDDIVPNTAATLLTTVGDYTRFISTLFDPHNTIGLSPATRSAIETPAIRINSALSWGLGFGIEQADSQTFLWQWGDNGVWKNFLLAHPTTQSGIVIFTNGSNGAHVCERIVRAATDIDHPAFLWI
ncbi:MAG TPA: serine hydrolase domain-containing protein [Edaphobacter sp.]|nr:serine hydrolase domain-containing protein [Edaphobacter sp.]